MIGIVGNDDWTAIEFRPFFASDKMKWATLVIEKGLLPDKWQGEWGFAFKSWNKIVVYKGLEMHFVNLFNKK